MEKRLQQKVEEALAGVLGPTEQLLVGTNGMHPRLGLSLGTMASILIGTLAGSALQTAIDWGPTFLGPFAGAMLALVARWLYIFRSRSELQPAGAIPLIGLTDQRLVFVETDFWGRPTGVRHEVGLAGIANFVVRKWLLGLPNTIIDAGDGRIIHYQIRFADRIEAEIDRLAAES